MAARKTSRPRARRPSSREPRPEPTRRLPPPGDRWLISLCTGGNRWKRLDWVGSHAEADFIADHYRRSCRRVAVHRQGQPPRERTAPVLPTTYRPPQRDPDHDEMRLLLRAFYSGEPDAALLLHEALVDAGYDWAAIDLRDTLRHGCVDRQGIAARIASEAMSGTVLEHGPSSVVILESRPDRESHVVEWRRVGAPGAHDWTARYLENLENQS